MKIKVINPNTTEGMTDTIRAAAESVAAGNTEIMAVSPTMGPVSIEGNYDEAMSVIGLLDEVHKGEVDGCDGYVVACFSDPGLHAAREIASGPVVGIAEAAMHTATLIANGFSVVSTLPRTRALSEHLIQAYGMEHKCRSIRATNLAVLDLEDERSNAPRHHRRRVPQGGRRGQSRMRPARLRRHGRPVGRGQPSDRRAGRRGGHRGGQAGRRPGHSRPSAPARSAATPHR